MHRLHRVALPVAAAFAVATIATLPPIPGASQGATPEAACARTTPEQNEDLVRRWYAALDEGSADDVAALTSPDLVYHAPSPDLPPQTDGAGTWADKRQQDYPDLTATVEHVFATEDMAAAYTRYAGTQSGDAEDAQGVPVTGQSVEWVGMAHFRFECGRIAEVWSIADDLGRLRRLNVITIEELQSVDGSAATPTP